MLYLPVGIDRENTPYDDRSACSTAVRSSTATVGSAPRVHRHRGIVGDVASVEGRAMLHELGVRFVVSPVKWDTGGSSSPFVERAAFEDRTIYEVRSTPKARPRWWTRLRRCRRHQARCRFRRTRKRRSRCDGLARCRPARSHCEPSRRRQTTARGGAGVAWRLEVGEDR